VISRSAISVFTLLSLLDVLFHVPLLVVSDVSDVDSPDAEFYDLVSNPERYTGYTGQSAVNIWKLIYDQNCFKYFEFCHYKKCLMSDCV